MSGIMLAYLDVWYVEGKLSESELSDAKLWTHSVARDRPAWDPVPSSPYNTVQLSDK